jgi:DNA-3-methyladenine glycosylase
MALLSSLDGPRSSTDLASFLRAHRLPAAFYRRDAAEVARDLLGAILVRREGDGITAGFIVEGEAYYGEADPASHAHRGRTPRNAPMFGPGGHAYVYFVYGNHFMLNVVTGEEGSASAVLLRALEPAAGFTRMRRRRGGVPVRQWTNGPGRLARALGIGRAHNGMPLTGDDLFISAPFTTRAAIARSGRIGVARGGDRPLRFHVKGSPFVSRGA